MRNHDEPLDLTTTRRRAPQVARLRMAASLLAVIDIIAGRQAMSRSETIRGLITEALIQRAEWPPPSRTRPPTPTQPRAATARRAEVTMTACAQPLYHLGFGLGSQQNFDTGEDYEGGLRTWSMCMSYLTVCRITPALKGMVVRDDADRLGILSHLRQDGALGPVLHLMFGTLADEGDASAAEMLNYLMRGPSPECGAAPVASMMATEPGLFLCVMAVGR